MTESRRRFKQALSTYRQNVESERSNAVQEKFKNKNKLSLWKEVKKLNIKVKTANTIDEKTEDDDIAMIFSEKLFGILDEDYNRNEGDFLLRLKEKWKLRRKMKLKLSTERLKMLTRKLNEAVGHDEIHSRFLKLGSEEFLFNMVRFINS